MLARNVNKEDMEMALAIVNKRFGGNVIWNKFVVKPRGSIDFTLRTKNSRKAGSHQSIRGRRLPCACWHAHGFFFEALIGVNPMASVYSRWGDVTVNKDGGNWRDFERGTQMQPRMASEMCECSPALTSIKKCA